MFFKRHQSPSVNTAPRAGGEAVIPIADDAALDTLVGVLRAFARHTPDVDGQPAERTRALVDQWVRHATLGQPLTDTGHATPAREWRALVHAFADHRRLEASSVRASLTQLRDMIWTFVGSLHAAAAEDEEEHQTAARQLERMRDVLDGGSLAELRDEARATVAAFDAAVADRRHRRTLQVAELGIKLRDLGEQLEEAREASTRDPLTGLANRKEFDDFLRRLAELNGFVPRPACLLMIDVDGFKGLNDTHGHQAGDAALQLLAGSFARVFLRRSDFVCRYGGDEFAIVMQDTPMAAALQHAERLRSVTRDVRLPGSASETALELSIGIAELQQSEMLDDWLRRADRALYRAKDEGRDRVVQAEA